ncbi:MAG: hypothetical protein ABI295_00700 [Xanthomarina sp.]
MKYFKNIFIFTLGILFFGCASFSKKDFKEQSIPLNEHNLDKLNGNYSFYPINRYGKLFGRIHADSLKYTNSYQEVTNHNWKKKQKLDSILTEKTYYSIAVKLSGSKRLHVSLLENGTKIRDTTFNGKIKNGMFYLDNKFLKCWGILYLFGGCQNNKRRIGLSLNTNLITNEAISDEGAFLFIFGAGVNYNASYEFERIP